MHIALDLDTLRVTHYHRVPYIRDGLVHLECAAMKNVLMDNTESPHFFDGLTHTQLDHIYTNTTASKFPSDFDEASKRAALAEVFEQLAVPTVVESELDAQIEAMAEFLEAPIGEAVQLRYVKGANVPEVLDGGLFPVSAKPLPAARLALLAQGSAQRMLERAPYIPPAPAQRAPAGKPAPPRGGARAIIWAHADKVWEAAGKPMQKDEVLVLRKRMMVELEEQGIPKTTSSTALGDWMKVRIT